MFTSPKHLAFQSKSLRTGYAFRQRVQTSSSEEPISLPASSKANMRTVLELVGASYTLRPAPSRQLPSKPQLRSRRRSEGPACLRKWWQQRRSRLSRANLWPVGTERGHACRWCLQAGWGQNGGSCTPCSCYICFLDSHLDGGVGLYHVSSPFGVPWGFVLLPDKL